MIRLALRKYINNDNIFFFYKKHILIGIISSFHLKMIFNLIII